MGRYWFVRFLILRLLGLVYLVAFLAAAQQNRGLLGSHGLTPIPDYLQSLRQVFGAGACWKAPSLFWLGYSDFGLDAVAWAGVGLSLSVLLGLANSLMMLALWVLYMSIVHVGQDWYAFGWEIQLLETGFLAVFLCPLFDPRPFPKRPPPTEVIYLYRWLGLRIMLGAGLIKLRGDACWRDLTCLDYFFQTQPVPNPLSWYAHHLPRPILHAGVLFHHFVELLAPWCCFAPARWRRAGAVTMISFQLMLILGGNLSFLNWLTIVPLLAFLDDGFFSWPEREGQLMKAQRWAVRALAMLVALLSLGPIGNLLSSGQAMNTSFDPLELVNTYGAFGSVEQTRNEIILEGSLDGEHWLAYEFKVKPGDPARRPSLITPYHYRLDWLMWFAAMGRPEDYPWIYSLVDHLLRNDPDTLNLLAGNPFPQQPPRWIRGRLVGYRFTDPGQAGWWSTGEERVWLPASAAR